MLDHAILDAIIRTALAEDVGSSDVTSQWLIPNTAYAQLHFVAREPMVVCGAHIPGAVYHQLNSACAVHGRMGDGERVDTGTPILTITGPAQALLTGERVALNLMQRLCGISTLTRQYVDAVAHTKAIILDTRKTMPGLRYLDKYAVRTGGGQNHRMGLFDAVMIKDNHIAFCGNIIDAVRQARAHATLPIIVECDTLEQVKEALQARPDRILLDNMTLDQLSHAVRMNNGRIPLEASGGVSLANVASIAETGVDFISVGKLTHSAPAADIGADIIFEN